MKRYLILMLFIISLLSCNKEPEPELEPCELYATGIYNDTIPGETPKKFWPCMNTEYLVEAGSYNFPALYMLMGGCCGLQSGYDLCRNKYSWFTELENREDALEYLIAKYASIDTVNYDMELLPIEWGGYKFYTYNLEVFLAQEAFLSGATDEQRLELLDELFEKQEVRKGEPGDYFVEGPTFTMGRVMYYNNYKPLIDSMEQNFEIKTLVELGSLSIGSEEDRQAQISVFDLANKFINELKMKSE